MVGTNERATFVCVCVLCEMNSDIKIDVKRLKQERKPTLDWLQSWHHSKIQRHGMIMFIIIIIIIMH